MVLVHDDDLKCIGSASLGSLQPDTVMEHLRRSRPLIQSVHCHRLSANKGSSETDRTLARVAMLSERGFEAPSPVPTMFSTTNRGVEPSTTPCLDSDSISSPVTQLASQLGSMLLSSAIANTILDSSSEDQRGRPSQNVDHQYISIPFVNTTGCLVRMFGPRDAAFFIESLLKTSAREVHVVANVPGWPNALMVSRPSMPDSHVDALYNDNHPLWLLDFVPLTHGSVIPQKIWSPPNQSDWRRYIEQANLLMPVFFVQNNGIVGLPLPRAAVGDTATLRHADQPAPLGGGHSTQIRIAWPGYESWERQIQIRDQTRARNEITLERFAKLVAGVVDRFIAHSSTVPTRDPTWRVGEQAITRDNVIVVGTVQVSAGGWMPILQIAGPASSNLNSAHAQFYQTSA
ncbi:hypothetical protein BJV78DRAFT_1173700 [Lactifluus subvellereus]|nr:hypothetical protein BJV78DRAFT_1173700 [Lactifluus subvellereus]